MIIVLVGLLGLIFGSFVNAAVWRLHEQEELRTKKAKLTRQKGSPKRLRAIEAEIDDLSIVRGRSRCPACGHTLAAKDLVPVLSWLLLGGKCRYCGTRIPDSPLVELATGIVFALSYASWPLAFHGVGLFQFVLWLGFVVAFMVLAVYDLRWFILPDKVTLPLLVLAAIQVVVSAVWLHSWSALWEPAVGALIIFGLFWGLFQLSKGAWIGGGDVKLAMVLGLLAATPGKAFLVIFFASLLGTVASVPLLLRGTAGLKRHIPFGPYLLVATILVVLYGGHIVSWYQDLLV